MMDMYDEYLSIIVWNFFGILYKLIQSLTIIPILFITHFIFSYIESTYFELTICVNYIYCLDLCGTLGIIYFLHMLLIINIFIEITKIWF